MLATGRLAGLLFLGLLQTIQGDELSQPISAGHVVDLTHRMHQDMPFWPGTAPLKIERLADYDEGYRLHRFSMWENIGTHVDAPAHFVEGNKSIDKLSLGDLILPIAVINVQDKVKENPDYALSPDDILKWEQLNDRIPPNSLVVMNTGWYKKFHDPAEYINRDDSGILHFPGFSAEAAELLVSRDVAGIGIDTMSLDPGRHLDFPVHKIILGADKFQVENLNNLDALPARGATAVIGVLPIKGGTQAQARIFALFK